MNDSVWIPVIHSGNAASQMRFLWNMKLPINSRGDIPLVGYLMLDGWYHPLNTYHVLSKREFWAHGSVQPTNGPRHWADLWWMQRLLATQRWLGMFYREMKLFRIWIYTYQVSIYLFIHRSIHPSIYRKSSLYIRTITYIYGDVLCMIHAHPEVNTRLGHPRFRGAAAAATKWCPGDKRGARLQAETSDLARCIGQWMVHHRKMGFTLW